MLAASTPIRVLDLTPVTGSDQDIAAGVQPVEIWRGRIDDFERDNGYDEAGSISLRTEILISGRSFVGGGAAPTYRIERA